MASAPFKVKALFEYTSSHEDDLPFDVGQIITVTDVEDPDWYGGEYIDAAGERKEGIFPRNFVEKFEPTAPPRPTRSRKKDAEPAPAAAPPPVPAAEPEPEPAAPESEPVVDEASTTFPLAAEPRSPPRAPVAPAPKPAEPAAAQPPPKAPAQARSPPPVSDKPKSSSFKDRIAAFNKPAAPPVAPFKPGSLSSGGSNFIKKPFVAPPPSRNAYVPPPREPATTKVYRRDEDPEIREREAENLESAQHAGLAPAASLEDQDEDQPKPTTLKERIALLQKQQAEAAQRHAESASKREKPKRPEPKKRTESEGPQEATATAGEDEEALGPSSEAGEAESAEETQPPRQLPTRRKSSKDTPVDGNEADMSGAGDTTEGPEDLTEREDADEKATPSSRPPTGVAKKAEGDEPKADDSAEVADDEDLDPEARRKEELRARMAKMSGGMGMMGINMFGAPMPPPKKKMPAPVERRSSEQAAEEEMSPRSPAAAAPPVPTMMALPGMGQKKPKEEDTAVEAEEPETSGVDDVTPIAPASPRSVATESTKRASTAAGPPPVPTESRPPPPPPPAGVASPSVGSETDDELSEFPARSSTEAPAGEPVPTGRAPPPPIPMGSPRGPTSPRQAKRASYTGEEATPSSPQMPPQPPRRDSRPPPPIPGSAPPLPIQGRPPPPPPPGAPSRSSTMDERVVSPMQPGRLDNGEEGEVTEYEGDYDTDIGSSVPHKEALKAHARDSSLEDNTPIRSPASDGPPPSLPPPLPTSAAPRAVPPPIPSQPAPSTRTSVDAPRVAPPPPPPAKTEPTPQEEDEYDPYNYTAPKPGVPTASFATASNVDEPEVAPEPTPASPPPPPPGGRNPPPAPPMNRGPSRQSMDAQRTGRRSVDVTRPSMSMESGFVADEVDLAEHTNWWLQPNGLPPVFQGRKDIYFEIDENKSSKSDGATEVTKEVYILFQDYSQTFVTVRFDPQNPADTQLDQRHEPPPRSLRQDQLEQAYERFGLQISTAVVSKKDSVVGDGTPQALVYELLRPFKDALLPVGTRAYGALVYANIANASTQMHDEIRAGDIISIRNAKFQGKHGPMHAKYSVEVGKPDHVGVVAEWDGVKKKVRAWEQGRESKKVKQESFRLEDLRSGEVKIWRVMPRSWVGWDSPN